MASKFWIKLYHEILDDPKMGRMGDRLWRRFIECLLMAGDYDSDGYLPPLDDMSWRLRTSAEMLEAELNDLGRLGMVELRDAGWYVTHFSKRQQAVGSTERWRKWRDRQRKQEYYEGVTDPQPSPNESQTIRLTDIDIDKNRIDIDKSGRPPMHEHIPEPIIAIRTAILTQVKTRMTSKNETEFNDTAYAVFGMDATPEEIKGFDGWWSKHGYYDGLPARQSFEDEYANYQRSLNGHVDEMVPGVDFKVFDEVDE